MAKVPKATGRPQANIDWNIVDEYLVAGCSGNEIAAMLGINHHTLYDRCLTDNGLMFSEYSQQKKEKGDSLLRKAQFDAAVTDKDRAMLIWLGKQRLDQRDKADLKHQGDLENPVIFQLDDRFQNSQNNTGISEELSGV